MCSVSFSVGLFLRDMDLGAGVPRGGDIGTDFTVVMWGLSYEFTSA